MTPQELHQDAIVIDGLIIANWSRAIFEDMRKGGLTAANCTCSVWENARGTLDNIARWKQFFRDNADLITPVHTTADILRAKQEGRTGIILGWQNLSGIEDQIPFLKVFKDLGVGVMQMAYNTQNLVGTGCYESKDGGLSDFGREVVAEMNAVGILCDLSHVGSKTSEDVILESKKPVAYTHCLPSGLKEHPRNKSDAELRFIAERGGFIGVTMFTPFLAKGIESTVDDYVEAMDYIINIAGEDSVGVGTDFTQGYDQPFFEWLTHDKGYLRRLTRFGKIKNPTGFETIGEFPSLTAAMLRAGWSETKVRKVIGGNWMRVLKDVWGA
ncbi:dipeptidase [Plasticicumulans acidivorans]|uniref:Membrane dipeptidase n=1 Tax=Plasticicumulans acidivorans TaxID=886464 RepID=A0A317MVF1_9GAMM|nr:dipeptidase [Plasticicumulans acidivorans]PWV62251.1 membrane dipeptidase [Plasticicumulans acidivorans]